MRRARGSAARTTGLAARLAEEAAEQAARREMGEWSPVVMKKFQFYLAFF